jgi:V/A-type H+/Na+-transporting ATPase subunit K
MERVLVAVAASLAIGIPALATAWVQSRIGAAGSGALAEKPELRGAIIVMLAIPETLVILGFVVAVLILLGKG